MSFCFFFFKKKIINEKHDTCKYEKVKLIYRTLSMFFFIDDSIVPLLYYKKEKMVIVLSQLDIVESNILDNSQQNNCLVHPTLQNKKEE